MRLAGDVIKSPTRAQTPTARNFALLPCDLNGPLKTRLNFAAGAFTSRLDRARCPFEWNSPRICLGDRDDLRTSRPPIGVKWMTRANEADEKPVERGDWWNADSVGWVPTTRMLKLS